MFLTGWLRSTVIGFPAVASAYQSKKVFVAAVSSIWKNTERAPCFDEQRRVLLVVLKNNCISRSYAVPFTVCSAG